MQLKPVHGNWIFDQYNVSEPFLWRNFSFFELSLNERQKGDRALQELCSHLRIGNISLDEQATLKKRRLNLADEQEFASVIRIYPTNKQAEQYNDQQIHRLAAQLARQCSACDSTPYPVYEIHSTDLYCAGSRTDSKANSKDIPKDTNKTAGIPSKLLLCEGARVMLRKNINIAKGLVNGAMGTVKSINWKFYKQTPTLLGELPANVTISFDPQPSSRIPANALLTAIEPLTVSFDGLHGSTISRTMLPFILCWGVTVHKMQGISLEKAVLDLGERNFAHGQIYVAVSRICSLRGLRISAWADSKFTQKSLVARKCLEEYDRLRSLNH